MSDPSSLVSFAISQERGRDEIDLPVEFAHQLRDSGIFAGVLVTEP